MMKLLLDTETLNINCKMTEVQEAFLDQSLPIDLAEDIKTRNIYNGSSAENEVKDKNGIVGEHKNFKSDENIEVKKEIGEEQQIAQKCTKIDTENELKTEESNISIKQETEELTSEEKQHDQEKPLQSPPTQKNTTSQGNVNEDSKQSIKSEKHLEAVDNATKVYPENRVIEKGLDSENCNSAAEEIQVKKEPSNINYSDDKVPEPMQIDEVIKHEQQAIEPEVIQTTVDTNDGTSPMDQSEALKKEVVDDNLETNSETEKPHLEEKMETIQKTVTATEGLGTSMEIDAIVSSDSNISNNITDTVKAPATLEKSSNCTTTVKCPEVVESIKLEEHSEPAAKHVTDDAIESTTLEAHGSDVTDIDKNNEDVIEAPELLVPSDSTVAAKTTSNVDESVTPTITSESATTINKSDDVTKSATVPETSEPATEKNNDGEIKSSIMEVNTADDAESKIPQVSSESTTNKTSDKIIDSTIIPEASKSAAITANVDGIESSNSIANKTTAKVNDPPTLSSACTNVSKAEDVNDSATTSVSNVCRVEGSKQTDDTTKSSSLKEGPGSNNTEKTTDDIDKSTIRKESKVGSVTNTTEDLYYELFDCKKLDHDTENVTTSDKPEEIVEIDCTERDQVIDIDSSDKDSGKKEDGALDTVYNCEDSSDGCAVVESMLPEKPDTQKQDSQNKTEISNKEKAAKTPVAVRTISGLSNNLDIISDEEDDIPKPTVAETAKENFKKEPSPVAENKCINLDDDDDIMVIDEEVTKEDTNEKNKTKEVHEKSEKETSMSDEDSKAASILEGLLSSHEDTSVAPRTLEEEIEKPEITTKPEEKSVIKPPIDTKPIVPVDFLKSFKSNIADLTREELEEFCLVKIVEGIVEKSNLSDIKAKLKTMAQNNEDWRKKAMMLTKQNRDLQIVLKAVQEEQKRNPNSPITPLKITRSVGMQVFMTEANERSLTVGKRGRQTNAPGPKPKVPATWTIKSSNNNNAAPIPVPRLVPAAANSPAKTRGSTQVQSSAISSNTGKASPANPVKPVSVKVAEKRPFNNGSTSLTVDLTDDEPPAKQTPTRAPVRLVSQQHLMPPRAQVTNVNSPRKVYIPINSQNPNQLRTGNAIMLKSVAQPMGIRHRPPMVRLPNNTATAVRALRPVMSRHPAPLPDVAKQQQPPNWKALPPSPDLKISKVENGIVISWKIEGYQEDSYEEIASYQLYAYQETTTPPSTLLWKKIGDVKALPLPMACTLTQFMAGFKYYFAVRAVDIRSRIGPFSLPGSILLLNK